MVGKPGRKRARRRTASAPGEGTPAAPAPAAPPRARLEAAAEGLLYVSESEAPFEYVEFPGAPAEALTPAGFRALLGEAPGAKVEERALDDFLAPMIERADPADPVAQQNVERFRALRDALRGALREVRVLRVGEVEVRAYLVGWAAEGVVAGLMTRVVET